MNFGQWMQAHRRSLLFVIGLLAVAGALTAFRLPISLFPNVAFPRAVVSLDAQSGLYYLKGQGSYGRSTAGRYACRDEADSAGMHGVPN